MDNSGVNVHQVEDARSVHPKSALDTVKEMKGFLHTAKRRGDPSAQDVQISMERGILMSLGDESLDVEESPSAKPNVWIHRLLWLSRVSGSLLVRSLSSHWK